MEIVIIAEHLTLQAENRLLVADLCFEIPAGIIFGLIGPPQSGKTTTIRLLTGSLFPTGGEAKVFGQMPTALNERARRKIGYMPQHPTLYTDLTLWENLNFQASLYGMRPFRHRRFTELLSSLELLDEKNRLPSELSQNQQRKVSLAAALVHRPDLLLLDEPGAGLSAVGRQEFHDYFRRLRSAGRTLFVTTQSPADATFCDQIALIYGGRLLMAGAPEDLRTKAFGGHLIDIQAPRGFAVEHISRVAALPFVQRIPEFLPDGSVRIVVSDASTAVPALAAWCTDHNIAVAAVEEYVPPFDETFAASVASLYD